MPQVHLLGTGAGASDGGRTTTMLALENVGRVVLVDCGGDVVQRMQASGLDPLSLEAMIVTHEHPDHCAGFPLFIEKIWLLGRKEPIPVYGIAPAIDQARRIWEAFDTRTWTVPPIEWREVAHDEGAEVFSNARWRITAAPGIHSVPVIGLRAEDALGEGVLAYSCDTAPSEVITRLARGATLLIHEATGTSLGGHSTAEEAAAIAKEAGAERLVLVHLPAGAHDAQLATAREVFSRVELGADGGVHAF